MYKRILVVDDDTELREILMEALECFDFKVKILADGSELLVVIRDFRPDLLILDNVLPGENGETLCKRVRTDNDLSALPVILISAYPGTKPFDLEGLLEKVNGVLNLPKSA